MAGAWQEVSLYQRCICEGERFPSQVTLRETRSPTQHQTISCTGHAIPANVSERQSHQTPHTTLCRWHRGLADPFRAAGDTASVGRLCKPLVETSFPQHATRGPLSLKQAPAFPTPAHDGASGSCRPVRAGDTASVGWLCKPLVKTSSPQHATRGPLSLKKAPAFATPAHDRTSGSCRPFRAG